MNAQEAINILLNHYDEGEALKNDKKMMKEKIKAKDKEIEELKKQLVDAEGTISSLLVVLAPWIGSNHVGRELRE